MKAIYQQFLRSVKEEDVTQAKVILFYHNGKINLDRKDKEGKTLLHHACQQGSLPVVRLLVDHGTSIELQDNYGNTGLHYGCMFDHFQVVRFLLTHCANVYVQNKDRQNPAELAEEGSSVKTLVEMAMSLHSRSNRIMTLGRVRKNKHGVTRTRSCSRRKTDFDLAEKVSTDEKPNKQTTKIPSFRKLRRSSLNICRIKKMNSFGKESPKMQSRRSPNTKWSNLQALRRSASEGDILLSKQVDETSDGIGNAGCKIHKMITTEQVNLVGLGKGTEG